MGVTIIVNMMTVSHKGSNGVSLAFPDPCKTPTPAGPVPIPYPNIAKSSDTSQGSKTVKMDGNPIMLKGSNMMMSTGDEAGAATGVVSSKIKGKAEFVNYSFDVKVDGKNVCRLMDPTQQNMGSANAFGPAHIQPPGVVVVPEIEACKKTNEKKEENKEKGMATGWEKSGVYSLHQIAFQDVADEFNVNIFIRASNPYCVKNRWIPNKHQPKPHDVIKAKTISGKNIADVKKWLDKYWGVQEFTRELERMEGLHGDQKKPEFPRPDAVGEWFYGVVMSTAPDEEKGMPMRAQPGVKDSNGYTYKDKWITGDYDLMDLIYAESDDCARPFQGGRAFGLIKRTLNRYMEWDGIQHGPQSQWISVAGYDQAVSDFAIPVALKAWLNTPPGTPVGTVEIAPGRDPMPVCDDKLTVVYPDGDPIYLEDHEDAKDALLCCGCHKKINETGP